VIGRLVVVIYKLHKLRLNLTHLLIADIDPNASRAMKSLTCAPIQDYRIVVAVNNISFFSHCGLIVEEHAN
jgi:hypothetical protein